MGEAGLEWDANERIGGGGTEERDKKGQAR